MARTASLFARNTRSHIFRHLACEVSGCMRGSASCVCCASSWTRTLRAGWRLRALEHRRKVGGHADALPLGLRASPCCWPRQVRQSRHSRPRLRRWSHLADLRYPPSYRQVSHRLLPEVRRRALQEHAQAGPCSVRPHSSRRRQPPLRAQEVWWSRCQSPLPEVVPINAFLCEAGMVLGGDGGAAGRMGPGAWVGELFWAGWQRDHTLPSCAALMLWDTARRAATRKLTGDGTGKRDRSLTSPGAGIGFPLAFAWPCFGRVVKGLTGK